uniref:Major facilitator superfamily domain containing 2B n=1 Tax=Pavo cristatus TaxID=9049 RepID=A0A8C9F4B3_PAVCR
KKQNKTKKRMICSKLCYAIGGAPNQVAGSAASFFLQIYLLDIAQITPFHASLVLFTGKASGAVTDPVAGFFISKSRWTKIGHLMPWMLACTPFTVVSYFFMWYLPPFVSGRVVWYLSFYCIFQALTTVSRLQVIMFSHTFVLPSLGMTMEVLGTLVGAALQGQIVASAHLSDHCTLNPPVNTTSPTPSLNSTSGFPEPSDPLSHQVSVYGSIILFLLDPYALSSDRAIPFCEGLGLTMKHGPYVKLAASFLLISTAVQVTSVSKAVCWPHSSPSMRESEAVSAVVSIPFWQKFLQRFGKKCAACGISVSKPLEKRKKSCAHLLSMLPDVVDNFRLQNPHRKGHETIFYSSYVFFTKMSAGIGLGISAACLE